MITRRQLLQTAALTGGASALPAQAAKPGRTPLEKHFRYRGYLGWIVDLDSRAEPTAPWPSIRLDQNLLDQYRDTFPLLHRLGFNEAVVWGIYVGRSWPLDIKSAITPERAKLVNELIDAAHKHELKLIAGLGVFDWGFEELIKTYPALGPTNPRAMCASNPDAWGWMEKVTDFVFTRFPIDGVSMQSADQGRCSCEKCSRYSDSEYHSRINVRLTNYIRAHYPNKLVAVAGWGMKFEDPASLPFMKSMSENIDYLIDVVDSAGDRSRDYRRQAIGEVKCAWGTIGGPLVEPPLHYQRDRWFLPTPRTQGEHLTALAADGGRACEYFFHIRANPGDEVTLHVAGKLLNNIDTPWQTYLRSTLEELYAVSRPSTVDALFELFSRSETAYMSRIKKFGSGDISLEPLNEAFAGPPIYLTKRLTPDGRTAYSSDLLSIAEGFRKLRADIPDKTRIDLILRCLDNVQKDLKASAA